MLVREERLSGIVVRMPIVAPDRAQGAEEAYPLSFGVARIEGHASSMCGCAAVAADGSRLFRAPLRAGIRADTRFAAQENASKQNAGASDSIGTDE